MASSHYRPRFEASIPQILFEDAMFKLNEEYGSVDDRKVVKIYYLDLPASLVKEAKKFDKVVEDVLTSDIIVDKDIGNLLLRSGSFATFLYRELTGYGTELLEEDCIQKAGLVGKVTERQIKALKNEVIDRLDESNFSITNMHDEIEQLVDTFVEEYGISLSASTSVRSKADAIMAKVLATLAR